MLSFTPDVISAVLSHMNTDHVDDNLVIVRANGCPSATSAEMTGLDAHSGVWSATVDGEAQEVRIAWAETVVERPDIRRQVASLYRSACDTLGIDPRQH